MPVPTVVWTVPVAARQDPAVPITTSWGNDTWDNLQFLVEWLGADYVGAAAQNHNHDGVNSAKVNIFEGLVPNGNFEEVSAGLPISWTATEYTGGTVVSSTAVNKKGSNVIAITSTVLANGGGEIIQDEFKPVTDNYRYGFEIYRWATVANVSCSVDLVWYDKDQVQISTTTLVYDVNTATAIDLRSAYATSPANARYVRVKIIGGVPALGAAVGTVYFSGCRLIEGLPASFVDAGAIAALPNDIVTPAAIQAGAVHTSELNVGTSSISTTATSLHFTLSGGVYSFCPQHYSLTPGNGYAYGGYSTVSSLNVLSGSSGGYETRMTIGSIGGDTTYLRNSYVATSPPHDMGDGDIPAFIYAVIDNATGDIESISYAHDPVWQANGPTDATPTIRNDKGKFKLAKEIPAAFSAMDKVDRALAIAALPYVEVEITEAIKHADMDIIPHPFSGNDLAGKSVVMLDPVSGVVRDLFEMDKSGEDVHSIIRDKYISIGNSPLKRVTPAGLLIPDTRWKKTRAGNG